MTMIRKLVQVEVNELADDEVELIMSTAALARDGHVLIPSGCRLENYERNPIVLWNHDPEHPIGNSTQVVVESDLIRCRVKFAPLGISQKADEVRGLVKSGVVRAGSVGFDPIEGEPLEPRKPKGGQRFSDWELLELSFVSVPSDTGAVVTKRAKGTDPMTDEATGETQAKPKTRATTARRRTQKVTFARGLYDVAELCHLLARLGWAVDQAEWEAMLEGDGSQVPAMLGAVFADLGDALLAMTAEEVAEAIDLHGGNATGEDVDDDESADVVLVIEERQHIAAAASPAVRAFRRGLAHAKLRAGKSLSAETVRCLREARSMHDEAMDMHRSAMRKHKDAMGAIDDMMDRAGVVADDDAPVEDGTEGERSAPVAKPENAPAGVAAPMIRSTDYQARQAALAALATPA